MWMRHLVGVKQLRECTLENLPGQVGGLGQFKSLDRNSCPVCIIGTTILRGGQEVHLFGGHVASNWPKSLAIAIWEKTAFARHIIDKGDSDTSFYHPLKFIEQAKCNKTDKSNETTLVDLYTSAHRNLQHWQLPYGLEVAQFASKAFSRTVISSTLQSSSQEAMRREFGKCLHAFNKNSTAKDCHLMRLSMFLTSASNFGSYLPQGRIWPYFLADNRKPVWKLAHFLPPTSVEWPLKGPAEHGSMQLHPRDPRLSWCSIRCKSGLKNL